MPANQYAIVATLIFTVVAIAHAARLYYGWAVAIGPTEIPMSVSWAAMVVAGLMAVVGFAAARQ